MSKFNVQAFAEEYADRLQSLEEYAPINLFLPGSETANIGSQFNRLGYNESSKDTQNFINRYQFDYLPKVQQLARDAGLRNISEEMNEFVEKTGLEDPRLKGFFPLDRAKHEIISHMRPFKAGFVPDLRNLTSNIEGFPGLKANPVSPMNENMAVQLDGMIRDNYSSSSGGPRSFTPTGVKAFFRPDGFTDELTNDLVKKGSKGGLSVADAEKVADDFVYKNFNLGGKINDSVAEEISNQLNTKYLGPARTNFQQTGQLFYPTGGVIQDYVNNRESFQNRFAHNRDPKISKLFSELSNPGTGYMSADPFTATLSGAKKLIKRNPTGANVGVATSLLDPILPQAIKEDDYLKAGEVVGRDILGGAFIEKATKKGLPLAGRYLPQLTPVLQGTASILSKASPFLTGAALFTQGAPGSLTDVVTQKAGANPISFLPSAQANPKTDIGSRSGKAIMNEGKYLFNSLLKGQLPYTR